ncbi:hypothetical protein VKT23_017983 [Stygiomarasmius scandens]|uniref:Uncharacterized protein n=1 Tax=Marasmiellus scandens TaxID=2682957 RepID=A0ABR1IQN8_9AGAR
MSASEDNSPPYDDDLNNLEDFVQSSRGSVTESNSDLGPNVDDIRTEFHPHSNQPSVIEAFEDFGFKPIADIEAPSNLKPWEPFATRFDYEVSEFALKAGLNNNLTDELLQLLHTAFGGCGELTMQSYRDMQRCWDNASVKASKFEKATVSVDYHGSEKEFPVHFRPLWDWVVEIATDPKLGPELEWDARKYSKYDGGEWIQFIEEPWTADLWWRIQAELPHDAKPFFIILYADKNKLSSFGTQKGYPVIARCANLPSNIRNGTGLGGGRVVGWLPIVEEEASETGKTGFVNFKNAVWHSSFEKIIESIIPLSETGHHLICGDKKTRHIFPIPYILSADYEEQCIMALIRGIWGLYPCPKCLVKRDAQFDLSVKANLRTAEHTQQLLYQANNLPRGQGDQILQDHGLRPIQNVFFKLSHMDPYLACSFDELHFGSSGVWGAHFFEQFKAHLKDLPGRNAAVEVDAKFDGMPGWRGLNHFKSITTVSFNDGSKHRDISKIFLFAAHNVFSGDQAAFQLLRCLRAYHNMSMYGGLDVQTEDRLKAGRAAVVTFHNMMTTYKALTQDTELGEKSWNFPKMHYYTHLFDDIEQKGVQRVYGTKPNEKMHGPLRKIYHGRTNFKDVADQILRIEHQFLVATVIRTELDILDNYIRHIQEEQTETTDNYTDHFTLGSKLPPIAFQAIENAHASDTSFSRFRTKLAEYMTQFLLAYDIALPGNKAVKYNPNDVITPYQFLKVRYESMETWREAVDYLRCNPNFHHQSRFDFVLFQKAEDEFHFGQLLYLFTTAIKERQYAIALIQPYKVVPRGLRTPESVHDRKLGLIRLRKNGITEFIAVASIIRGILAPTVDNEDLLGDRYIFDLVDGDSFLRMKSMYPGYTDLV